MTGDAVRQLLAEIQQRAERATAGPWKVWAMQVLADPVGSSDLDDALAIADTQDPHRGLRTFNADFIAASRSDVPRLVAALTAALDQCDEIEAEKAPLGETFGAGARTVAALISGAVAAALQEQP